MESAQGEPDAVPPGQLLEPPHSGTAQRLGEGKRLRCALANKVESLGEEDHIRSLLGSALYELLSLCNVTLERSYGH